MGHEMEGTKTTGRSQIRKMVKRIKTPDPEENPASKFISANKYAALSVVGEDENEGEDYTE